MTPLKTNSGGIWISGVRHLKTIAALKNFPLMIWQSMPISWWGCVPGFIDGMILKEKSHLKSWPEKFFKPLFLDCPVKAAYKKAVPDAQTVCRVPELLFGLC
jgi:hypothetical protein